MDGRVDERKVAVSEGFEYQGFWWLPGSEKDKVPGTLRFDPDEGAILDLLGSPKGLEGVIEPIEPKIILWLSSDGEYITLKDCGRTKGSVRFGPGFATSTFAANTVFVGAQFGRAEDVGFERLIVEYLHLGEWTGASGFEIKAPKDLEVDPLVVEYRLPEPVTARVGDQYEVSLRFWASLDGPPGRRTEATVTQTAGLVVKSPEKRPLEDLMEIAYRLQHFLSLGVRRSVYPVSVWGAMGTPGEVVPVEIHYRPLGMTGDTGRPRQRNMLFSLRDLPEGFGPAVARWLERAEILDPVYRLYLGTVYNPESFLEQQFLNLVQALEVYHRRAMHTTDLPEDEHERRKEEILEAVPAEHRDWLEGKLEYSNEPSLGRRLKDIIRRFPEATYPVAGENSRDRDRFIRKVTATRNYHTHFDQRLEGDAAHLEELYHISKKLRSLIEVCLMGEIGFDPKNMNEAISRTR